MNDPRFRSALSMVPPNEESSSPARKSCVPLNDGGNAEAHCGPELDSGSSIDEILLKAANPQKIWLIEDDLWHVQALKTALASVGSRQVTSFDSRSCSPLAPVGSVHRTRKSLTNYAVRLVTKITMHLCSPTTPGLFLLTRESGSVSL